MVTVTTCLLMQDRFTVAWISVRGCVVSQSSGGIVLVQIFFPMIIFVILAIKY